MIRAVDIDGSYQEHRAEAALTALAGESHDTGKHAQDLAPGDHPLVVHELGLHRLLLPGMWWR